MENRPAFARVKSPEEFGSLPTPSYVLEEAQLEENCRILAGLMERTGCKVLLAQKALSNYKC